MAENFAELVSKGIKAILFIFSAPTIAFLTPTMSDKYHSTSGLMQILHFDWLRYYRSISNGHRVAKFAGFVNVFTSFYSQMNIFLLNFLLLFSVRLVG